MISSVRAGDLHGHGTHLSALINHLESTHIKVMLATSIVFAVRIGEVLNLEDVT